jgi:undecaprenyl-diphosphatase
MIDALELLDRNLFLMINGWHSPIADRLMWFVSKTWPTVLFVLAFGGIVYRRLGSKKMVEFLVGCCIVLACTDLTSNGMKHGVKRARPTHHLEIGKTVHVVNDYRGGEYGFFSGHAANTFGVTTFIFLCLNWISLKKRLWLFVYPLIVAYSRIYLGVHYPSDVIAGTADGLIFGSLGFLVMNRYFLNLNVQKT